MQSFSILVKIQINIRKHDLYWGNCYHQLCPLYIIISPKLQKIGYIMFLVWMPCPPYARLVFPVPAVHKACVSRARRTQGLCFPCPLYAKACFSSNCDTNAHIKFIFDTAIDDPEWKNRVDCGENKKNKKLPMAAIL